MTYLSVRNWKSHQHYSGRRPPWIKFYTHLLDDQDLRRLPYPTRLLWDQLLLLAARHDNAILNDSEEIWRVTRIEPELVREGVQQLLKGRWLLETQTPRRASKPASKRASNVARAETETDKNPPTPLRGKPQNGVAQKRTGWRYVRGSHGHTYVKDPVGTDTPPKGYA